MEKSKIMQDDARFAETQTSSELIFDGRVIRLFKDEIRLPDGRRMFFVDGTNFMSFRHSPRMQKSTLVKIGLRKRKCFLRKVFSSEESKGENDYEQL